MPLTSDRDKCAHLLRRFGLGASETELDYYLRDGLDGAVDKLMDAGPDEGMALTLEDLADDRGIVRMPQVVVAWVFHMLTTRRPLREKMTLFWHDHFATSAAKVNVAALMQQQNDTLREHALGSFRGMLQDIAKDPAMIYWLDNQENVAGKPNENFAREVMELFTLGVDQGYTEHDIQEAARAFTGWTYRRAGNGGKVRAKSTFLFRPSQHDDGEKEVFGVHGNLTGEDVLNMLCDRPRTAEYLTRKIWEWFVYPNPDEKTIRPFADRYLRSGLDTSSLVRDIMLSPEFYSDRAHRSVVKNPVDICVTTLRQLGYGEYLETRVRNLRAAGGDTGERRSQRQALAPAGLAANVMKSMGMALMFPPDVAGWEIGSGWISSATMVERIQWADRVFGPPANGKPALRYPIAPLISQDPTPEGLVKTLLSVFDADVKPERVPLLISAAKSAMAGTEALPQRTSKAAVAVARLIFAAPEFQFA